ncbi:MAG: 50S ribosomal protein L9 [Thermoanaerobacterales bacterium 50_218]|nr:MAG: 50S ribosomal protein L9 [Thermoanaerobacterales bacterium 50_218]HAA89057.1 50S ribosomal protein L9 [Peptococcaceae bacterium]
MKVILCQDVKNLGKKGDIVEVAEGYGRNYLFPRGLAVPASEGKIKEAKLLKEGKARKEERARREAQEMAKKIEGRVVKIASRAGEEGKLYGAVTSRDIARALSEILGKEIDKRKVELEEPLKMLGSYPVSVRLYPGVQAKITVEVVPAE